MSGEGLGGICKLFGPRVFGQAGGVERLCKRGGLLGQRGVAGDVDGVEVERLEKGPLLVRGHERVGHEGIEGLEALDIDLDGRLVALLCAVKRVELGVADTTQVAHSGLRLDVVDVFAIALLARGQAVVARAVAVVAGAVARVDMDMAQLRAGAVWSSNEVSGVLVAKDEQGVVCSAQLDGAVGGQVAALGSALNQIAAG
jgi:hypothetical protein